MDFYGVIAPTDLEDAATFTIAGAHLGRRIGYSGRMWIEVKLEDGESHLDPA